MLRKLLAYHLRRSVLVCSACLALFAGVFFARTTEQIEVLWIWFLVAPLIVSLRRHNIVTVILLCLVFFGLGWWRGSVFVHKLAVHETFHYQKVTVVGRAADEAVYGKRSQLEFTLRDARVVAPEATPIVGTLTVRGFGAPAVYRGDIVQVTGKLYPTLGNNQGSISYADLTVLAHDATWIDSLRQRFAAGMQSALPEPLASFALGLIIGQRATLPEDTETQLKQVGLTHIIAVSGYNLTVIVIACRRLLAKYSKFQATATCVMLVSIFLLVTGSSPPIVRASIISMLGIAAWYYGRSIKPLVLLLVGAAVTVLMNPMYLWGNVSWYLSFLAFYGVLFIAPLVNKRLFGDKEPKLLLGVLVETFCASIMVAPYVLYIFGETSLVGLISNMVVVPLIPLAMLLGLVAGLAGMLLPVIAGWFAWPATLLLTAILDLVQIFSKLPYAFVEGVNFSLSALCIAYATIEFVVLVLWQKTRRYPRRNTLPFQ